MILKNDIEIFFDSKVLVCMYFYKWLINDVYIISRLVSTSRYEQCFSISNLKKSGYDDENNSSKSFKNMNKSDVSRYCYTILIKVLGILNHT